MAINLPVDCVVAPGVPAPLDGFIFEPEAVGAPGADRFEASCCRCGNSCGIKLGCIESSKRKIIHTSKFY